MAASTQWAQEQIRRQVAIAGRVTNSETKQAIAGVRVEIHENLETPASPFNTWLALKALQYGDTWEKMPERPDRTYTKTDGSFRFLELPRGTYTLTLTASVVNAGTRYSPAQSQLIIGEQSGQQKRAIAIVDLALTPTAIKGKIADSKPADAKKPGVVMAKVQIEESGESTLSEQDGSYLLMDLEAAQKPIAQRTVTVKVFAQGYRDTQATVTLSQGQVAIQDFILERR
ncbi:hypothetical protein H6G64_32645 [Calothrix sp. FACHB-156]|nr:hypothetical protein [Calothrix sp. FACHB-156]